MRNERDDEPQLQTVNDCIEEIIMCRQSIRHRTDEYDAWMKENPQGDAKGMLAMVSHWQARIAKAESKLKQLNPSANS